MKPSVAIAFLVRVCLIGVLKTRGQSLESAEEH
jgi:hypothetical protein